MYQSTNWVTDPKLILHAAWDFERSAKRGEPVRWHWATRWHERGDKCVLQHAIFRDDCHIERRHDRGHENEPVVVEDP